MLIYLLYCRTTSKGYVGQTTQSLEERWASHLYGDQVVDQVIRETGTENWEKTILIDNITNLKELDRLEDQQIVVQGTLTPNGYNQCPGGTTPPNHFGKTRSQETRAKMSKGRGKDYRGGGIKKGQPWSEVRRKAFHEMDHAAFSAKVSAGHIGQIPWNKGLKTV